MLALLLCVWWPGSLARRPAIRATTHTKLLSAAGTEECEGALASSSKIRDDSYKTSASASGASTLMTRQAAMVMDIRQALINLAKVCGRTYDKLYSQLSRNAHI